MADENDRNNSSNNNNNLDVAAAAHPMRQQPQQPPAAAVRPGAVRLRTGRRNRSSLLDDDDDDGDNGNGNGNGNYTAHSRLDLSLPAAPQSSPGRQAPQLFPPPFGESGSAAAAACAIGGSATGNGGSSPRRNGSSSGSSAPQPSPKDRRYVICDMDHIPEEEEDSDGSDAETIDRGSGTNSCLAEEEKEEIDRDDGGDGDWADGMTSLQRDVSGVSQFSNYSTYSGASAHSRSNVEPLSQSLGGGGSPNRSSGNNSNHHPSVAAATTPAAAAVAADDSYWWCCCCGGASLRAGAVQLGALLRWRGLRRRRAPAATALEICTPALLVLVLVAAYRWSDAESHPAATHSDWNWQFPPAAAAPQGDGLLLPDNGNLWNDTQFWAQLLLGPEAVPLNGNGNNSDLETAQDLLEALLEGVGDRNNNNNNNRNRRSSSSRRKQTAPPGRRTTTTTTTLRERFARAFLHHRDHPPRRERRRRQLQAVDSDPPQQPPNETSTTPSSTTTATATATTTIPDDMQDLFTVLDAAHERVRDLFRHPVPVPSLPDYAGLSGIVQRLLANYRNLTATAANNDTGADAIAAWEDRFLRDSRYARQWGNVLTPLGTLHVVPAAGERVRQFREHLDRRHPGLVQWLDGPPRRDDRKNGRPQQQQQLHVRMRLHESEEGAVAFMNGAAVAGERTWGLIDLTAWPAPGNATATTAADGSNATTTATSSEQDDDELLPEQRPFYKIRLNYTTLPSTAERIDPVPTGLNLEFSLYYLSGFLTLQRTLNEFAFAVAGTEDNSGVDGEDDGGDDDNNNCYANVLRDHSRIWSMPFPTAEYNQNAFYATVGPLLGLTITMAFLFPVARLIKLIVEEKETRQRELLFVMGLQPWAHWWSWFLTAFVTFAVNALLVTWTLSAQVLQYSSFGCLLVWIFLFSTASIGFCFFIAAFFVQSKLAAVTGPILLFATLLPRFLFFESNRYQDVAAKRWASLLPATAFALGADVIADYEFAEIGVHSAWRRDDNTNGQAFTFQSSIFFLLLDTFLYLILGWYVDQVIPRSFGKPLPFYFLLSPRYWLGDLLTGRRSHETGDDWEDGDDDSASASSISSWSTAGIRQFEHEPNLDPTLVPTVEFRHLEKYYRKRKGVEPALADLNLILYQDQITSLIGHNGAGKSTCLGVLTGMLAPTSGDCFIGGRSITREPRAARRSVGYCPQDNILCDRLSVREHIAFYMRIKGVLASEEEVRRRALEVGLGDFYYARAGSLSGGSKRKLMLAISFAGDPELLVLDEPTSGMDPASRRKCWECLRLKRPGRVIVLVSHAMSEADLCSDRIAILKDGVLQASGSPAFLKKRFGLGYNLTLVITPERRRGGRVAEAQRTFDSLELQSRIRRVTDFLQDKIPEAELVRVLGTEVVFRVPNGFEDRLPIALSTLDLQSRSLGIGAFGIENSSLEEVVLFLSEESSQDDEIPHDITAMSTGEDEADEGSCSTLTGNVVIEPSPSCFLEPKESQSQISVLESISWTEQVGLLYWKRYTIQKRDLKGLLFSVVAPTLVVALVLLILNVDLSLSGPAIEMSPTTLGIQDTDILIGGGAAFRNRLTKERDIAQRVDKLRTALEPLYGNTHLHHAEGIRSSDAMSDYLLESISNYDGNDRYGSFVLEDVLNLNVAVDWPFYEGDFQRLLNNTLRIFTDTEIDIANERVEGLLGDFPGIDVGSYLWIGNYIIETMQERVANSSGITESVFGRAGYPTSEANYSFSFDADASILHNSSSTHAVAIFDKVLFDALFGLCNSEGKPAGPANKNRLLVSSINHPLPLSTQQTIEVKVLLSVLAGMFVLIPFCYVPGAFVVVLVKEIVIKSKFLQVASGAKESAFWVSGYLWDVTLYSVLVTLVMCVMLGYRSAEVFVGNASSFFCTATLFWGYGLSIMPFSYLIARRFRNPSSAQLAVISIIFVTGFVAVNAYYIMNSIPKTQHLAGILRKIFRLWPAFNLGDGLVAITGAFWERNVLGMESNPFDWDIAGFPLVLLFTLSIPYFGLVLILEGSFQTLQHALASEWEKFILDWYDVKRTKDGMLIQDDGLNDSPSQDDDVIREKKLVSANFPKLVHSSPVIFSNTWKVYLPPNSGLFALFFVPIFRSLNSLGRRCCHAMCLTEATGDERQEERQSLLPKRAVRGLSFALRKGEAFVLLGVNGSGKSTALSLLSGEIQPTSGAVFVAGYDVNSPRGIAAARKRIGICPQSDPLLERMTGRETLRMFARLRGMPKAMIDPQVENLLELLMLSPYADKNTEEYSGGNRRKLALGIALVGDPDVLLIDESCSGVDPASQRKIWNLIIRIAKDRSVLLTSHSMDETQALSSRTAIMSGGKLLCLGSVQHLKTKYLDGYTIDVFLFAGASTDQVDLVVHEVLERTLPGSVLVERHGRFLRFEVSNTTRSRLGPMFRSLEDLKNSKRFGGTYTRRRLVEEYSIRQCDLEQVFLKLVKRESEETRKKKSKFEPHQSPSEQRSHPTPDLTVPMASDDSTAQSEPSPTNS